VYHRSAALQPQPARGSARAPAHPWCAGLHFRRLHALRRFRKLMVLLKREHRAYKPTSMLFRVRCGGQTPSSGAFRRRSLFWRHSADQACHEQKCKNQRHNQNCPHHGNTLRSRQRPQSSPWLRVFQTKMRCSWAIEGLRVSRAECARCEPDVVSEREADAPRSLSPVVTRRLQAGSPRSLRPLPLPSARSSCALNTRLFSMPSMV
jgi:hypothetical protein